MARNTNKDEVAKNTVNEVVDEVNEVVDEVNEVVDEVNKVVDDGYVNIGPLPYDADKYKHPLNVIINGTKYSIPRGQIVRVPKVVAEVINQSMAQDMHAAAVEAEMMKPQIINF